MSKETNLTVTAVRNRLEEFSVKPDGRLALGSSDNRQKDVLMAGSCFLLVFIVNLIWFSIDHRFPTMDEAGHIMSSFTGRELLLHFRPWQHQWWHHVLTISPFYPPVIYMINGAFLLVLGQSRLVEHIYMAFFSGLLIVSTYVLTRSLKGSPLAAVTAGLFLSSYPLISWLGHTYFLDMPAAAMAALSLVVLLWWRRSSKPTMARTLLTGVAIGIACLSKQLVAFYVIPAGLYFLACDLVGAIQSSLGKLAQSESINWLKHTLLLGVVTMIVGLPFIIANYQFNVDHVHTNTQAFASQHENLAYLGRLATYCHLVPLVMSPILLITTSLMSLFSLKAKEYRNLLPVIISAAAGVCLLSFIPSEGQDSRYLAPFLIAAAILSGVSIQKLFSSTSRLMKMAGVMIICLVASKNLFYNFAPYPVPIPQPTWFAQWNEHEGNPVRYQDWGHSLVIDTINKLDRGKLVYLNILPNHEELHINAFQLLLREQGIVSILPTGSRPWTIVGDRVDFDPATAWRFHYYLLKTGYSGFRFYDRASALEYAKLTRYIRSEGPYNLVASKALPDGSELLLYRRNF